MKITYKTSIFFDPLIKVSDDGLLIPEVRRWSLEKYELVGSYCDIFSSGMKNKWHQRVYIDLFAGAGYARISHPLLLHCQSQIHLQNISCANRTAIGMKL
jgi:hypothetical protein